MAVSEERRCENCGTFHLKNISFFAYWAQCKQCGLQLCQHCSGLGDRKVTQFVFLTYMLVSYLFYFGIFLIIAPIENTTVNILSSYMFAGILLFVPYFLLLLLLRSVIRRFQKAGAVTTCPKCNGPMRIITHDIYLYFFLFLIHILYISTLLNETGIYFFNFVNTNPLHLSVSLWFIIILVGLIIPIIYLFRQIGGKIMAGYKMNTRVWLGETFAVFLYIALNVILLVFLNNDNLILSFDLFYYLITVVFWYFPAFLIGGTIYKIAQNYLLNVNKSRVVQILISVCFIILPFYIWGLIGIYLANYYVLLFKEIVPIILIAFLLGTGVASLLRKYFQNISRNDSKFYQKIFLFIGISLFTGFLLTENLYYLISGNFLLDNFTTVGRIVLLVLFLIVCLALLFQELLSNWMRTDSQWGKSFEKRLGSLLYPILIGFIIMGISLGFSHMLLLFSSTPLLPNYSLTGDLFMLKLIFTLSFAVGLIIAIQKK